MFDYRAPGRRTMTRDDVDDARGDASLFAGFHQVDRRERRVLRRLDDDRVAAHERGDQLPRRDRHREVPRRDEATQADGLAHAHRELVGHLGRRGEAVQPTPFARGVERAVNRLLHVAAGLLQDLAHLARHVGGETIFVTDQYVAQAEQNLRAARRGQTLPRISRFARGGDGA